MKKLKKYFDVERQLLSKYDKIANKVLELEEKFSKMSDEDLVNQTSKLKAQLTTDSLEQITIEALATVREASVRTVGLKPFKVQIVGALALLEGNISEMKTGEGKTLTSALTAYVWSLLNKGVHIVTVNDYLASRDAENNKPIYEFLGLSVRCNNRELTTEQKREAYESDIMYTTNSELGFDYLRDNMVAEVEDRVNRRGLNYVIIDEVDSVLVDEARTPLIISGSEKITHNMYKQVDALVKGFHLDEEYKISLKDKTSHLLQKGIEKTESIFNIQNLYDVQNSAMAHAINQSLKANFNMSKDVDYVVKEGKIVIIDQFTGRTMEGRMYSDGLHQAIEAKEHVTTQKESRTMATITYQNFFRLYEVISGMTGTAKTEEEEFQKTYGMDVIEIPTNMPIARLDMEDVIFTTKHAKFDHLINFIKERHELGQPILIGTVSIESSEEISRVLTKSKVKHQVLNAKNHAQEANIIANAGKKSMVTISTNMAGRGTDIKLDDEVKKTITYNSTVFEREMSCSGLLVIGTERHESRRIDNQLRGRSGRQGDEGQSVFFVSFEDQLLARFTPPTLKKLIEKQTGMIEHSRLTKSIESTQKQVESIHYQSRTTILKYDDVLREQREIIYSQRDLVLTSDEIVDHAKQMCINHINNQIEYYESLSDMENLELFAKNNLTNDLSFKLDQSNYKTQLVDLVEKEFSAKTEVTNEETIKKFVRIVIIKVLDDEWINHIDEMQTLRESISLRSYGQIDPLIEYQREGRDMYDDMVDIVEKEITRILLKGRIQNERDSDVIMNKMKSSHDHKVHERKQTFVKKGK